MTHVARKYIVTPVVCRSLLLVFLTAVCSSSDAAVPPTCCQKRAGLSAGIDGIIDEFRASVPEIMRKRKVPGAAVALFDEQGIIWTEGFGYAGGKRKTLVTPDTLFLINGMSKIITTTAVMLAVQDGLVDLDEPITAYLPDFTVYSRFEKHPEEKITLRRLLSNTAGMPVEARLGNHFEPSSMVSLEDHVKSIFGTCLVCPVGESILFSNTSFDLAAYIIQVVSEKPFEQYMKERIFSPLGMSNSTVSTDKILKSTNRAVGHLFGLSEIPAVHPSPGGAGVYTSTRDLARFVQLHINKGAVEGRRILDESLMDAMHTPIAIIGQPDEYYGPGIYIDKRDPKKVDLLLHQYGWGFGFFSFMLWYPEYGIGAVALTNTGSSLFADDLALTLTDKLVKGKVVEKRFSVPAPDYRNCVSQWEGWSQHNPTPYKPEWKKFCGTHPLRFSGFKLKWWARLAVLILGRDEWTPRIKVFEKDGYLCLTESNFFEKLSGIWKRQVEQRLEEVEPGLFFTSSSDALDFRSEIPTWRNYRLKRGIKVEK